MKKILIKNIESESLKIRKANLKQRINLIKEIVRKSREFEEKNKKIKPFYWEKRVRRVFLT